MSGQGERSPWLSGRGRGLGQAIAARFARRLVDDGYRLWQAAPGRVTEAIDKVEAAWALVRSPDTALLLASLYDRANRNASALKVLRRAFHDDPDHPHVRLQAASTVLRHGTPYDVADFVASVLSVDPGDAFAQFADDVLRRYDGWVDGLAGEIEATRDGRVPFVLAYPVWGQPFADNFARFTLASLASPRNLPALARQYSAHVVVFTDEATEAMLRRDPVLPAVAAHARVHFVRYDASLTAYGTCMASHYAARKAFHSDEPLAAYYARECKFVLMSCAHYVSLLAGRRMDAMVSCGVADLAMTDGTLAQVAEVLHEKADAVLMHAIQMPGEKVRSVLDNDCRTAGGALTVSREQGERLLVELIADRNYHGSLEPYDMPLRICWRAGPEGVLVHGNHFHPIGLRPARFAHPLRLTTDPTDSRFIDRTSLAADRIHLVQDGSMLGLSVDDDPLFEGGGRVPGALSNDDFALWLWGYWGRLRGYLFDAPIRVGRAPECTWRDVEMAARPVIEDILSRVAAREVGQASRKSWRLPGSVRGCPGSPGMPETTDGVRG